MGNGRQNSKKFVSLENSTYKARSNELRELMKQLGFKNIKELRNYIKKAKEFISKHEKGNLLVPK